MSDKDIDLLKKEAAAKAKAAALAKQKRTEEASDSSTSETEEEKTKALALAKAKAAAAAKAKAAALAKQKRTEEASDSSTSETEEEKTKALALAKAKAAAAAKAKAAALAKQKRTEEASDSSTNETEEEKTKALALAKAKAVAAAKAKLAAQAKQVNSKDQKEVEKETLPNQEQLDKYVGVIKQFLGEESLEEYYINKLSKSVPTIVVQPNYYFKVAELLRNDENLQFDYVTELHGTDYKTYMEVYVYLHSFSKDQSIVLKVKLDRNQPILPSLVPIWEGANWPECEAYDLLGIQFENHPNLKRILLGEDWVGYPLRKDYEPYDVEV